MSKTKFERILEIIARQEHLSVQEVREEMTEAMREGQNSRDPIVQARWAAIPRKGAELTLEEFVEYMAKVARFS